MTRYATTWAPTRAIARRIARRFNRRLAASTRKRVKYRQGYYPTLGRFAWCVWRYEKWRGDWQLVGAVALRDWS